MGNLGSVENAFNNVASKVIIIKTVRDIFNAESLVLPGVGSFKKGMHNLRERKLDVAICEYAAYGLPLLGICIGMQLLATKGYEHGSSLGLNLIPGEVIPLYHDRKRVGRCLHIGWNNVNLVGDSLLLPRECEDNHFYFVHEYHFDCSNNKQVIAVSEYRNKSIVAAVQNHNVFGVQFHPEKSQTSGLDLLSRFSQIS